MFINESGILGVVLAAGTTNLTGNIVASLLLIMAFLFAVCIMFGIELEYTAIIFLPLCISIGAYYSKFLVIIIVILIYVSTLIAKNWIFR